MSRQIRFNHPPMRVRPIVGCLLILCATGTVQAQATLEIRTVDHRTGEATISTVRARGLDLAMTALSRAGSEGAIEGMIYRAEREEVVIMDASTQTYAVIDAEFRKRIDRRMQAVASQMASQLKKLPADVVKRMSPESRARYEELLDKARSGEVGMSPPEVDSSTVRIEPTTLSGRYMDVPCRWYERVGSGGRDRYCAAKAEDVAGGSAMTAAALSMIAFYETALGGVQEDGSRRGPMPPTPFVAAQVLFEEGLVPVRTEKYQGDDLVSETELVSASADPVPAASFEPPPGYSRRDLMTGSDAPRR